MLTTALYERFASRGEADYQDKLLSAMRFGFGGHLRKSSGETPMSEGQPIPTRLSSSVATGDLAYKKIFPALQAMVKRGSLNVPVTIGVARSAGDWPALQARAEPAWRRNGGVDQAAFKKLCELMRYVRGDAADPPPPQTPAQAIGWSEEPGVLHGISARRLRHGRRATGQGRCHCHARTPASL